MNIHIRHAKKEDMDRIMLIEHESFHQNIVESRDVFAERIELFPEGFLLLEIDGSIAGYISSEIWEYTESIEQERFSLDHTIADVHTTAGSQLYISSIGILKRHRGKGYGKLLFRELTERINSKYEISDMVLIVSENWNAARKIYEKNGFQETQRIPCFFDDDENSDAFVMRKRL
ncbi:MAG: N-acetyltransferase [Methanolobus sp.]|nr:N-acetyltransferase [Methanolobus sp.]